MKKSFEHESILQESLNNLTSEGHCRPPTQIKPVQFDDILELWLAYSDLLWEKNKHKESCHAYAHEIYEIMRRQDLRSYNNELLDQLIIAFRKKGNRNSTINRKLSLLSKLLRKHHKNGKLERLPEFTKLPENNSRIRFLSLSEEEAIFAALGDIHNDYKLLAMFLVDTGARIGEALNMSWSDCFEHTITFWETKSKTPRTIPTTQQVDTVLASLKNAGLSGPFTHIKYYKFLRAWNDAKSRSGMANDRLVVPHILRHTCASRLAQSGVDIKRIQDFLGHRTLQMTLRYAHLSPKHLEICAKALTKYRCFDTAA